jgi:hypothetical protein
LILEFELRNTERLRQLIIDAKKKKKKKNNNNKAGGATHMSDPA